MNILVTTDKDYLHYAYVMLASLLENNSADHIDLYYIYSGIDATSIDRLRRFLEKYDVTATFSEYDISRIKGLKTGPHFSEAAYLRALCPNILPKAVNRILYLDPDIIVTKSLAELYNTDLGDYFLGAVEDLDSGIDKYEQLDIPGEYGYFNSGVLLIDLDKFRLHNVSEQVIDYARTYPERIQFGDQDALNAVLYDKRLALHPRWNLQTLTVSKYKDISHGSYMEFLEVVSQPAVIHYIGRIKPWHHFYDHPLRGLYWRYVKKTPYRYSDPLKYWCRYTLWKPKNLAGRLLRALIVHSPKAVQRLIPRALKHRLGMGPSGRV